MASAIRYGILMCAFLPILTMSFVAPSVAQYDSDLIAPELKKKAHAVVRSESVVLKLSKHKYTSHHNEVITVLSKKGDNFLTFSRGYKEGSSELKKIRIEIYDADGKLVKKVKSKEIEDMMAHDGFSIVSDYRQKYYRYETSNYPVTIKYSYQLESDNTYSLPMWHPVPSYNVSVERSTYEIEASAELGVETKLMNFQEGEMAKAGTRYTMLNKPVIFKERFSPSSIDVFPKMLVRSKYNSYEGRGGAYDDWKGFGKWMYSSFLSDKSDLNWNKTKAELNKLMVGVNNDRSRAKIIYDYVQENTRYVSIGLDEGGLEPLSAGEVHEVKYGDCKALSFYMKSLLELYDIKANYVAVHAGGSDPIDMLEDFPSVYPGNHAIINIPIEQDTVWLDCTSHDNPFDFLGSFTDDRQVIQITEQGGEIVRTPRYSVEDNTTSFSGSIKMDDSGDVSTELSIVSHGLAMEDAMGLKKLDEKEFDEYLKTYLLEDFDKLEVASSDVTIDEDALDVTQRYEFSADKYGAKAGDYMMLPVAFASLRVPKLKKDKNREQPIVFNRDYKVSSEIEYALPVGYHLASSEPVEIVEPYASYTQEITNVDAGKIVIKREFVLRKGTHDQADYNQIKRTFDSIIKAEKKKIAFDKKS